MSTLWERTLAYLGLTENASRRRTKWARATDPRLKDSTIQEFFIGLLFWTLVFLAVGYQVVSPDNLLWRVLAAIVLVGIVAGVVRIVRDLIRRLRQP